MILGRANEWGKIISSAADGTQPAATFGVVVTPGAVLNTYGSYASVLAGASVTDDVFGVWVCINSGASSTAARDTIVTIGLDPAGGTSFIDFIADLLAPTSSGMVTANNMTGVWYYFPVFIKAGTSIGAKASVNNVVVGTVRTGVLLQCQPSRPDLVKCGHAVDTFGSVVGSSRGTAVTPGTTNEGAYVELGTTAASHWFWQVGVGCNTGTAENTLLHADLAIGDATNKRVVIANELIVTTSVEQFSTRYHGAVAHTASGDKVYGRLQQAGTLDVYSMAAYAVRT